MKSTNHIPPGYKPSPLGPIPCDWEVKKINDVADVKGGFAFDSSKFKDQGKYQVVKMSNFYGNNLDLERSTSFLNEISEPEKESLLNRDDIVITLTGTVGKRDYGYSFQITDEKNLLLNQRVAKMVAEKVDSKYLYYEIKTNRFLNQFFYTSRGGTGNQANVGTTDLSAIKIFYPPFLEQIAIANLLSTWDKAIQTTTQLIVQKEHRKKWLMQQLLTGKKKLKGFSGKIEFHVLGPYIKEVSERNKDSKIIRVLSVTNSRGFINQQEQFDRVVASDDASNYKIIRKGQFAYNPSRVNVGSLDLLQNFEEGILSPMYVVFEVDTKKLNVEFLYYHLKSAWFTEHIPMFVQGSVRDSLSFDGLSGMKFFIPSLEEQTAIASVFQASDKEIQLLKAKTEQLKEQKNGLMQQLLTGKKRLKINN